MCTGRPSWSAPDNAIGLGHTLCGVTAGFRPAVGPPMHSVSGTNARPEIAVSTERQAEVSSTELCVTHGLETPCPHSSILSAVTIPANASARPMSTMRPRSAADSDHGQVRCITLAPE